MDKFVETNTYERYISLDDKNNEERRNELFNAVHERSNSWIQFKLVL